MPSCNIESVAIWQLSMAIICFPNLTQLTLQHKSTVLSNINVPILVYISPDRANRFWYPDRTNKFYKGTSNHSTLADHCLLKAVFITV